MVGFILGILTVFIPRILMLFILLLTNWCGKAFEGWFWPFIGWLLWPRTLLVYMAAMLHSTSLTAGWFILAVIALVLDIISWVEEFD